MPSTAGAVPAANLISERQRSEGTVSLIHIHAAMIAASGARFGRIAIAPAIARPEANGRRVTASTTASVQNAVAGTSLIALINWYRKAGLTATSAAPASAMRGVSNKRRPRTKVSQTV